MRLYGVHTSIKGGLQNAIYDAVELGCTAFQIFLHSPRVWKIPEKTYEEVGKFKKAFERSEIAEFYVHSSYLVNLVSENKEVRRKSHELLLDELSISSELGAKYYVLHLRDNENLYEEEVFEAYTEALQQLSNKTKTHVLIENTAAGRIGANLVRFTQFVKKLMNEIFVVSGIVIDSAHLFGAGYDFSLADYKSFRELKDLVKLLHLNDSKKDKGSGADRHEHLGKGKIGRTGLKNFLTIFPDVPVILETPKNSIEDDRENLLVLKQILNDLR